jgi:cytochrome b pre-mRNA-processing protein 3
MLAAFKKLFSSDPLQEQASLAYAQLVEQSRRPFFYRDCAVSDTLDGRFDVIVLHLFLVIHRLRREPSPQAGEFIRALQEIFFADMDRSLREMGASDTGIGKRIKAMAQAFYGRLHAYEQAAGGKESFKLALARNLYRGQDVDDRIIGQMETYAETTLAKLREQPADNIIAGNLIF